MTRLDRQTQKAQQVYQAQRRAHKPSKVAWDKLHALTVRVLKRDVRRRKS